MGGVSPQPESRVPTLRAVSCQFVRNRWLLSPIAHPKIPYSLKIFFVLFASLPVFAMDIHGCVTTDNLSLLNRLGITGNSRMNSGRNLTRTQQRLSRMQLAPSSTTSRVLGKSTEWGHYYSPALKS